MNSIERRATLSLASIFSFRMLGLFMILPVFTPYAMHLTGTTPFLIGLAMGVYGFTQALLQLPFGTLSDRISRKKIIFLGLVFFIIGSIIAALSHSIYGVIIGRALQGAGAIGSTIIALLTDLTRVEQRSKAMALIGISIGLSFVIAMVIGPILNPLIQVSGIFWLSALFGIISVILLYSAVPAVNNISPMINTDDFWREFKLLFTHSKLLILDLGIFCLHVILTASFVVLPILLGSSWHIYLYTLGISIIIVLPLLGWAERKKRTKLLFFISIFILCFSELMLWLWHAKHGVIYTGLILFFTAFNFLEANLPSLISRIAPPQQKGSAIGLYSTCQFLGIFFGGILGGWLFSFTQPATTLLACAIIAALWFWCAIKWQYSPD